MIECVRSKAVQDIVGGWADGLVHVGVGDVVVELVADNLGLGVSHHPGETDLRG